MRVSPKNLRKNHFRDGEPAIHPNELIPRYFSISPFVYLPRNKKEQNFTLSLQTEKFLQPGWQRAQLNLECVNEDISYSSASQINKPHHLMISMEYFHTVQELIDLPAEWFIFCPSMIKIVTLKKLPRLQSPS